MQWTLGIILLIACSSLLAFIWLGLQRVLRPLQRIIAHIQTIADGDLTHEDRGRKDAQ
ncbi:hypothetical protein KCP75_18975 [Salmonella enterica subsp. enterica]|nr:hypothetical protein KCP75_18975 [Salmonella enterica subsp. enterica]